MKVTFHGRVYPDRSPLSFGPVNNIEIFGRSGTRARIDEVLIRDGEVTCTVDIENTTHVVNLRNIVDLALRGWIDLIGFEAGLYFDLDIETATWGDGQSFTFTNGIPVLQKFSNSERKIDAPLLQLVGRNEGAITALACMRKAMREALATGFYCYQGIEAMRHGLNGTKQKSKGAWETFRQHLSIDEPVLRYVEARAEDKRHGRSADISDVERQTVFLILKCVTQRYFDYMLAATMHSSATAFPLLTLVNIDADLM